jgi:hypothetical protein
MGDLLRVVLNKTNTSDKWISNSTKIETLNFINKHGEGSKWKIKWAIKSTAKMAHGHEIFTRRAEKQKTIVLRLEERANWKIGHFIWTNSRRWNREESSNLPISDEASSAPNHHIPITKQGYYLTTLSRSKMLPRAVRESTAQERNSIAGPDSSHGHDTCSHPKSKIK